MCVQAEEAVGPAVEQGEDREEGRDGKKKKNRCLSCKKKVGLTGGLYLKTTYL